VRACFKTIIIYCNRRKFIIIIVGTILYYWRGYCGFRAAIACLPGWASDRLGRQQYTFTSARRRTCRIARSISIIILLTLYRIRAAPMERSVRWLGYCRRNLYEYIICNKTSVKPWRPGQWWVCMYIMTWEGFIAYTVVYTILSNNTRRSRRATSWERTLMKKARKLRFRFVAFEFKNTVPSIQSRLKSFWISKKTNYRSYNWKKNMLPM